MKDEQQHDLAPLIELAHHRWNIVIVAELHRRSGAKFITLANSLGISRGSLTASLGHLIELDLVMRNPGHGHPMRPEYLLTESGSDIGSHCLTLTRLLERRDETDLAFRKWTLPLVAAIGRDVRRFGEIRVALEGATARAVTLSLKSILAGRWASRSLIDAYPPAAGYRLMPKGLRILKQVAALY